VLIVGVCQYGKTLPEGVQHNEDRRPSRDKRKGKNCHLFSELKRSKISHFSCIAMALEGTNQSPCFDAKWRFNGLENMYPGCVTRFSAKA
jgi:hypothetical protein